MKTKAFNCQVKAVGDGGLKDGQFKAIVSVFNNVDHYGEVVMPGAFKDTLAEWKDRGDPIPVIWSHAWSDPFAHVGTVTEARETEKGLEILGEITEEDRAENPTAAQVYKLLKARRITQFSFGFDVEDGGFGERAEGEKSQDVYELRKLKLHEVGPCLLGVNPDTELLAVKARELDGRSLKGNTAALGTIRDIVTELEQVLAAADAGEDTTQTPDGQQAGGKEGSQEAVQTTNEPAGDAAEGSSAGGSTEVPASQFTNTTLAIDLALAELEAETD